MLVTVARLVMVPRTLAFATIVTVAGTYLYSPKLHLMITVPVQVPAVVFTDTNDKLLGNVFVSVVLSAAKGPPLEISQV